MCCGHVNVYGMHLYGKSFERYRVWLVFSVLFYGGLLFFVLFCCLVVWFGSIFWL